MPPRAADRLQPLLAGAFDHYAARTVARVAGLTDDEYFWDPSPGVMTIAWRLAHICSFLSGHGLAAVAFRRPPAVIPGPAPLSATEALVALDDAIAAWKRDLASVDDDRLWEPMGEGAGRSRNDPVASFVEHIHDEFVHHSAEVALLRDLYLAGGA
jgi:uncharacterized damage-inducible protein DinB